MNYRIWIGATIAGAPVVGAHCGAGDRAVCPSSEQIFPSQMRYRCVAQDGESYLVMTPTEARERDLEVVSHFPRADGSLSRRNS